MIDILGLATIYDDGFIALLKEKVNSIDSVTHVFYLGRCLQRKLNICHILSASIGKDALARVNAGQLAIPNCSMFPTARCIL